MGAVFLTSADLNNDGSTELLLSIELQKEMSKNIMQWFVEVTAYEIPNLKEFRRDFMTSFNHISYILA